MWEENELGIYSPLTQVGKGTKRGSYVILVHDGGGVGGWNLSIDKVLG